MVDKALYLRAQRLHAFGHEIFLCAPTTRMAQLYIMTDADCIKEAKRKTHITFRKWMGMKVQCGLRTTYLETLAATPFSTFKAPKRMRRWRYTSAIVDSSGNHSQGNPTHALGCVPVNHASIMDSWTLLSKSRTCRCQI